jgi:hypothetical protein
VPLYFGWGRAFGIAGVATRADRQRQGHAATLLRYVLEESALRGEGTAMLFARRRALYERIGFEMLDEVMRGKIHHEPEAAMPDVMAFDDVVSMYNAWSLEHPDRLRRDEKRWNYWKWNLRICTELGGGYLCMEGGLIRECIVPQRFDCWPMPDTTEWLGLRSMSESMGVPLHGKQNHELFLMGYNVERLPQMFMTDQF